MNRVFDDMDSFICSSLFDTSLSPLPFKDEMTFTFALHPLRCSSLYVREQCSSLYVREQALRWIQVSYVLDACPASVILRLDVVKVCSIQTYHLAMNKP